MSFCTYCGSNLIKGASFCGSCGRPTSMHTHIEDSAGRISSKSTNARFKVLAKKLIAIPLSWSPKRRFLSLAATVTLLSLSLGGLLLINFQADLENKRKAAAAFQAKQTEIATLFKSAAQACGAEIGILTGLEVEYNFMEIDTRGTDDFFGASYSDAICILNQLDMPSAVESRWGATRALDGTVVDSWSAEDGSWTIKASWTYHPDDGTNMTLSLDSKYLKGYKPGKNPSTS